MGYALNVTVLKTTCREKAAYYSEYGRVFEPLKRRGPHPRTEKQLTNETLFRTVCSFLETIEPPSILSVDQAPSHGRSSCEVHPGAHHQRSCLAPACSQHWGSVTPLCSPALWKSGSTRSSGSTMMCSMLHRLNHQDLSRFISISLGLLGRLELTMLLLHVTAVQALENPSPVADGEQSTPSNAPAIAGRVALIGTVLRSVVVLSEHDTWAAGCLDAETERD